MVGRAEWQETPPTLPHTHTHIQREGVIERKRDREGERDRERERERERERSTIHTDTFLSLFNTHRHISLSVFFIKKCIPRNRSLYTHTHTLTHTYTNTHTNHVSAPERNRWPWDTHSLFPLSSPPPAEQNTHSKK